MKAMARRPEGRYASCRDLAGDIELWLADEPVSAYREPAPLGWCAGAGGIARWSPALPRRYSSRSSP